MVQAKAKIFAEKLGSSDFKACHNVVRSSVSGEANDVDIDIDIFNGDETELFSRAIPAKTLSLIGEKYIGGKLYKEENTVSVCGNKEGDTEKPLIIGKAGDSD
ncbi:hypothetical protein J437_LFUL001367, partial [Ladona fulva]